MDSVGLFGLRPAELAALQVSDGKLHVGSHVKRNRRTMRHQSPPHLALPLDIAGREGEGLRMLQLFQSGLVKLPRPIQTAIAHGEVKPWGMRSASCWIATPPGGPTSAIAAP